MGRMRNVTASSSPLAPIALVGAVSSCLAVLLIGVGCGADGGLGGVDPTCEKGVGLCSDGEVTNPSDTGADTGPDSVVADTTPELDDGAEDVSDSEPVDTADGGLDAPPDAPGDAELDGQEVEGECETGRSSLCYSSIGECKVGKRFCVEGAWGECVGGVGPTPERCDGLDNDCDGVDDNRDPACECQDGAIETCGRTDVGLCELGSRLCVDGAWGPCEGEVVATARLCDDADRDCDGQADWTQAPCLCRDGDSRSCGNEVGICRQGGQVCSNGAWGPCLGGVGPLTLNNSEGAVGLCNGADDNCNGQVDEGCGCTPPMTQPCGTDVGMCQSGTQSCLANGSWGGCVGSVGPGVRQCDLEDRDCDGQADWTQAPCQCQTGATRACGAAVGECRIGQETCVAGAWGTCVGGVTSQSERCNGLDDDCDGQTDENLSPPTAVACWDSSSGRLCGEPNAGIVAPLATVQLDGTQSSDPDGQALSFSWRIDQAPAGSTVTLTNPTSPRATLFAQLAGTYRVCLRVTDTSLCQSSESCTSIRVVPSSRVHIQLTWDTDRSDLDLHFMLSALANFFHWGPGANPNCSKANDCFFVCPVPEWGAAGANDNPRLDIDDVDGFGPENINWDGPFSGTYPIVVHMWCDRPAGPDNTYSGNPSGPALATVRLYVDGVVVRTWTKTLTRRDRWHVADLVWNQNANPSWSTTARDVVTKLATPLGCAD